MQFSSSDQSNRVSRINSIYWYWRWCWEYYSNGDRIADAIGALEFLQKSIDRYHTILNGKSGEAHSIALVRESIDRFHSVHIGKSYTTQRIVFGSESLDRYHSVHVGKSGKKHELELA